MGLHEVDPVESLNSDLSTSPGYTDSQTTNTVYDSHMMSVCSWQDDLLMARLES